MGKAPSFPAARSSCVLGKIDAALTPPGSPPPGDAPTAPDACFSGALDAASADAARLHQRIDVATAGVGGILFDPSAKSIFYFSWRLPDEVVARFPADSNPIHQLEILPVLIALKLWPEAFAGRSLISFIDNEGAKCSLINGGSGTDVANRIVSVIDECFSDAATRVWFERVASKSNPADAPSRGEVPLGVPGWQQPVETVVGPMVRSLAACHLTFGPASGHTY